MSAAPGDFGRSGCGHHASDSCSLALIVDKKEYDAYWGLPLRDPNPAMDRADPREQDAPHPVTHRTETYSLRDAP